MSEAALQDPAVLFLIFSEIDPLGLFRIQRVCHSWRATIHGSKILLSKIFLHPGPHPEAPTEEPARVNPFLQDAFPWFEESSINRINGFTENMGNSGPWFHMVWAPWNGTPYNYDPEKLRRYKQPEASWRKMLPCWPPATQLQVHWCTSDRGQIKRLNFKNTKGFDGDRTVCTRPTWLTFGLLYDIAENAWFQGAPWNVRMIDFGLHGIGYQECSRCRAELSANEDIGQSTLSKPGRVRVELLPDSRSNEERLRLRNDTITKRKKKGVRMFKNPIYRIGFTDEFHFEDSLSLDDLCWDEEHEWKSSAHVLSPPAPAPTRRRFLGIRWGRGR